MNKMKSISAAVIVDGIGWLVLLAPWVLIYGAGLYQQVALYVTFIAYGVISAYGVAYLGGSLRCSNEVAYAIVKDLKDNDRWYAYFPVAAVIICASVAAYKSLYIIAAILIAPPLITWISRQILKLKANKVINDF